jgi:hypothetical protein
MVEFRALAISAFLYYASLPIFWRTLPPPPSSRQQCTIPIWGVEREDESSFVLRPSLNFCGKHSEFIPGG